MSSPEIDKFVKESLDKGHSKEEIRKSLVSAGWNEADINNALDNKNDLVAPSPNQLANNDYKHFSHPLNSIGYLIALISFFISVFAICYVFATAINFYIPEQNTLSEAIIAPGSVEQFLSTMASALAAVVVATPIYIAILSFSRKYEEKYPPIRKSFARKIYVFLIAIGTFCVAIGYAVWFIYNLLLGEYSNNKFLNFIIIFLVNLIPFIYYLLQLRDDRQVAN